MGYPKMLILSDGTSTQAIVDDVIIGKGIEKLEFSTQDRNGNQCATIRVLELNLECVALKKVPGILEKLLEDLKNGHA